jgi:cation-transporting ATPase 13A2
MMIKKIFLCYIPAFLTAGVVFLVMRWYASLRQKLTMKICPLNMATHLFIVNQFNDKEIVPVNQILYDDISCDDENADFRVMIDSYIDDKREEDHDKKPETFSTNYSPSYLHIFEYRHLRFIYDTTTHLFIETTKKWRTHRNISQYDTLVGLTQDTVKKRRAIYGLNEIHIHIKPWYRLLVDEILHPFYMFQVASMVLWCLDDYYYYASCIFAISVLSIFLTLYDTRKNLIKLQQMTLCFCDVTVLRDGNWVTIPSRDMVLGDIFELNEYIDIMPCDAVLLNGDCLMNESMLTGESIPVHKVPFPIGQDINEAMNNKRYCIYSGTKVVRVRGQANQRALACVMRIGFSTIKGGLVRSILFPPPNRFKFYRDAFKFIGVLFCIAMIGMIYTVCIMIHQNIEILQIIKRGLDVFTIVVPPALPASLTVGTGFAINRLKKCHIFCISPSRVNVSGKLNLICFDKTGTLTEDGLDILCVIPVNQDAKCLTDPLYKTDDLNSLTASDSTRRLLHILATCHSLKHVHDKLIGDPIDLKMFEFSGWELEENDPSGIAMMMVSAIVRPPTETVAVFNFETLLRHETAINTNTTTTTTTTNTPTTNTPTNTNTTTTNTTPPPVLLPFELGIIRSFEFQSELKRMSVIVKNLASDTMDFYVKGAPETIANMCLSETIPDDFEAQLTSYTKAGYRVMACAWKSLQNMTWLKAQKTHRMELECHLIMIGLIVFENRIKKETPDVIQQLHQARVRSVMVTGDNIMTAIGVARHCYLLDQQRLLFYPKFDEHDCLIDWVSVDDEHLRLDPTTLMNPYYVISSSSSPSSSPPPSFSLEEEQQQPQHYHYIKDDGKDITRTHLRETLPYDLAVNGKVFSYMRQYSPKTVFERLLVKCQIFARMSPLEKLQLIECLQHLGYCIAMCGDGANDCGALKAADVGVSLSEAEASIAAPFTSKIPNITCIPIIVREGRAALVTSFSIFKYMALYSLIEFLTVCMLYSRNSNLSDPEFLYADVFVTLPLVLFMARIKASSVLVPKRPTAKLVSKKVLISLMGQMMIQLSFLVFAFLLLKQQSWYKPPTKHDYILNCPENTVIFHVSSFQYVWCAIIFTIGPPFRKPIYTHFLFMASLIALTAWNSYMLLSEHAWIGSIMGLFASPLPILFRYILWILIWCDLICSYVFERWISLIIIRGIDSLAHSRKKHSHKLYKRILQDMKTVVV